MILQRNPEEGHHHNHQYPLTWSPTTTASKHYMFFVYIRIFPYWKAYPLRVTVQLFALWIWGLQKQVLYRFGIFQSSQTTSSRLMKNHGAMQTPTTSFLWTNSFPLHSGLRSSLAESLSSHSTSVKFSKVNPKCAFNTPGQCLNQLNNHFFTF